MAKRESNLVEFGEYSDAAAAKEREDLDSERSGSFISIKEGRTQLRILPPPKGQSSPFSVSHKHYIYPPGQDRPIIVSCPRIATKGKEYCPACEKAFELDRSGNPMDKKLASQLYPKRRVYCNVIDRKSPESGIQTWSFGKTIHDVLNGYRNDPEEPCDFTHPINGYDIVINRKGTGKNDTEYRVTLAIKPTQLADTIEEINDLITNQQSLEKYVSLPSDTEILAALEGNNEGRGRRELPASTSMRGGSSNRGRRTVSDDTDVVDAAESTPSDDY